MDGMDDPLLRNSVDPGRRALRPLKGGVEWPTLVLTLVIYGGWLGATYWQRVLPLPLRIAVGGWLIAWHGSLQHEAIHGHPTRLRWLNTFLVSWPLALWLPYALYRETHLRHHMTESLTLPGADPETCYRVPPSAWPELISVRAAELEATLLGRLILGPPLSVLRFVFSATSARSWTVKRLGVWALHLILAVCVLGWVVGVCRMNPLEYVVIFIYPGMALSGLRAFAEHRAHPDPRRRVAVVERAPVLGLLFLHNNLHALHHARPHLAWYRLPATYRSARAKLLDENGGLAYAGYGEIVSRYLLHPHDRVIHPTLVSSVEP